MLFQMKFPYKPLIARKNDLVEEQRTIDRGARPPYPVVLVEENRIGLMQAHWIIRSSFIVPILIAFLLLGAAWTDQFFYEWKNSERSHLELIEGGKKTYGEDFLEITEDPAWAERLQDFGPDMRYSFREYLHVRYTRYTNGDLRRIADISKIVLVLGCGLPLLIWAIRFRRRSLVYFDRARQSVYMFRKGRVFACPWAAMRIAETSINGMQMPLRNDDIADTKAWRRAAFQPSYNPLYSRPFHNRESLAYIIAFMVGGMAAVRETPYDASRPGFYLVSDHNPPEDFEEQLAKIHARFETSEEIHKVLADAGMATLGAKIS